MIVEQIWTANAYRNFNYLIACPETGEALAVDPLDHRKCLARAKERGFTFPWLYDESQEIARKFGATWTPEFFVLDARRNVVYMGALDDNPDVTKASVNHVQRVLDDVLAGRKPEVTETPAIGCRIRYARKRRRPRSRD